MDVQEGEIYRHAIRETNFNVSEMARLLRVGRATVYRKLRTFGLLQPPTKGQQT